jgi:hypothetical protein
VIKFEMRGREEEKVVKRIDLESVGRGREEG